MSKITKISNNENIWKGDCCLPRKAKHSKLCNASLGALQTQPFKLIMESPLGFRNISHPKPLSKVTKNPIHEKIHIKLINRIHINSFVIWTKTTKIHQSHN